MDRVQQPKRVAGLRAGETTARQLRILLTLLECGSVTLTATALGLSQPAVSQVLRRLRGLTKDPLLVRSGAKLVPTARGQTIIAPLRQAMAGIEAVIRPDAGFDPVASEHTFQIASADCLEVFFLPRLLLSLRKQAPRTSVMVRTIAAGFDYPAALERGELDAVIANWPHNAGNLRTTALLSDDTVCMFDQNNPLSRKASISLEDYLTLDHIVPTSLSNTLPGPIDARLAELGRMRKIRVMVPEFNLVPYVVVSSNLVFTCSASFARHYQKFLPLGILPAPTDIGQMRFYLLWHERSQNAVASIWLRDKITREARKIRARLN